MNEKTVADMLTDLTAYPADAKVVSYKVVVNVGKMRSTTTYSARNAKLMAAAIAERAK